MDENSNCKKKWLNRKLNNVDHVCCRLHTWMQMLGDRPTLVSSHDMLQGVHTDRASQNAIVCPSYLMHQVCQPCISLHIIHSSEIQKCTVIGVGIPEMHATRWLASVLIVFLKRLADFMKKMKICTIPTWTKFSFLHRNSKLVIWAKYPKSCIDHWNAVEALIMCKSFEQELMILCQINETNFEYTFLRTSWENGGRGGKRGRGGVVSLWQTR